MDVICFGQQNWDYCWTTKQHLLTRLAERGHRVLFVDPDWVDPNRSATSVVRGLRNLRSGAGLRRIGPGELHVLTYQAVPALGWRRNVRRHPEVVRSACERLGFRRPVALVLHPRGWPTMSDLDLGGLVYFAEDELSAFGDRSLALQQWIRSREDAMARRSDVVLAVSPRLAQRLGNLNPRTHVLPNAADLDHFSPSALDRAAPHPEVDALPGPRVTFVGQVDERLDQDLLIAAARRRPDVHWVLAGRVKAGVDVSRLEREPTVQLLGFQAYEALPGILRVSEAAMVPYARTELTRSCNPLKVYEYLATGLPVVATALDGLEWCRDVIRVAADREGFMDAVDAVLERPDDGREERLELARANGWGHRADELEAYLQTAIRVRNAAQRRLPTPMVPERPRFSPGLGPRGSAAFALARLVGAVGYGVRILGRLVAGRRPVTTRRILVARRSRLGDMVAILPALRALRWRFPEAHIALGVQPGCSAAALVRGGELVDEVVEIPPAEGGTREELRRAVRLLRRGFDTLITGADFSTILESYFSGAPRRLALDDGHPVRQLATRCTPLDPFVHEAENNVALVEQLTGPVPPELRAPSVPRAPGDAERNVDALLRDVLPVAREAVTLVAFHTGAQRPSRMWPWQRYAAAASALLRERRDLHILLTGSADEAARCARLKAEVEEDVRPRVHIVAGRTGLWELVALMRRLDAMVSNDTGVMHLGRACDVPLVAVLGPENDLRWGPHPMGVAPATALRTIVPCEPCKRWECSTLYCLRSIAIEDVVTATSALLSTLAARSDEAVPRTVADIVSPEDARSAHVLRRTRWRDWAALEEAGFSLPFVSLRGPTKAMATGSEPHADGAAPAKMADTEYPAIGLASGSEETLSAAADPQTPPQPTHPLVAVTDGDPAWSGDGLEEAVATLVREPLNPGVFVSGRGAGTDVLLRRRGDGASPDP